MKASIEPLDHLERFCREDEDSLQEVLNNLPSLVLFEQEPGHYASIDV